jgi:hypothetical protein
VGGRPRHGCDCRRPSGYRRMPADALAQRHCRGGITTRHQVRVPVDGLHRNARVAVTMHASSRSSRRGLWVIVGLIALLCVAAPASSMASSQHPPQLHSHESVSVLYGHLISDADHGHIDSGIQECLPDSVSDFLVPRLRGMLLALGLLVGLVLLWRLSAEDEPAVGRAPPRSVVVALSGPDILTLFCVARR